MQVMSSTIPSSSFFHRRYDSLTTASAAFSAFLFSKNGFTIAAISSLVINSQTPSLANTINLSSLQRSSSRISNQSQTNTNLPGSHITPTRAATSSPNDLVIASPGISSFFNQTLNGPIALLFWSLKLSTLPPDWFIRAASSA